MIHTTPSRPGRSLRQSTFDRAAMKPRRSPCRGEFLTAFIRRTGNIDAFLTPPKATVDAQNDPGQPAFERAPVLWFTAQGIAPGAGMYPDQGNRRCADDADVRSRQDLGTIRDTQPFAATGRTDARLGSGFRSAKLMSGVPGRLVGDERCRL